MSWRLTSRPRFSSTPPRPPAARAWRTWRRESWTARVSPAFRTRHSMRSSRASGSSTSLTSRVHWPKYAACCAPAGGERRSPGRRLRTVGSSRWQSGSSVGEPSWHRPYRGSRGRSALVATGSSQKRSNKPALATSTSKPCAHHFAWPPLPSVCACNGNRTAPSTRCSRGSARPSAKRHGKRLERRSQSSTALRALPGRASCWWVQQRDNEQTSSDAADPEPRHKRRQTIVSSEEAAPSAGPVTGEPNSRSSAEAGVNEGSIRPDDVSASGDKGYADRRAEDPCSVVRCESQRADPRPQSGAFDGDLEFDAVTAAPGGEAVVSKCPDD